MELDGLGLAVNRAVVTIVDAYAHSAISPLPPAKVTKLDDEILAETVSAALAELSIAPTFGFAEIEAAQDDFVRTFAFEKLIGANDECAAMKERLEEHAMVRFVGLVCHLLYWDVLRRGPGTASGRAGAAAAKAGAPSAAERAALYAEVLGLHVALQRWPFARRGYLLPVVHLALRCAVERLFCGAYTWFSVGGAAAEDALQRCHAKLGDLLDPQDYHAHLLSTHHRAAGARPLIAPQRTAQLLGRATATSPTFRALYPVPAAPATRRMLLLRERLSSADKPRRARPPYTESVDALPALATTDTIDTPISVAVPADLRSNLLRAVQRSKRRVATPAVAAPSEERAARERRLDAVAQKRIAALRLAHAGDRRATWS
ncbi:hypothetical protein M885DRAFT_617184 [Pelagophyceae sp. CCMP2097]|nr:hypothetical protein M885DRAFT_617184 [Pelagophyceae sp. CCMP2097]